MYGTGLLKGLGVTLKHFADTYRDDNKETPSRYVGSEVLDEFDRRIIEQPIDQEGLLTVQYPEERRLLPERFRYIPMLIWDTENEIDLCTACGICAKVCPPQCIWIVRDSDDKGKPVTRPAEFYIDAAVCMSCSFCVEFCPFDAIKMNHDYELAAYERYPHLVYDKAELTVPVEYYAALWPTQHAEEQEAQKVKAAEEKAKAEAKAKAAEEKKAAAANGASGGGASGGKDKPKRSPEEMQKMKEQAAAKAKARKASADSSSGSGGDEDPEAKKARLEELKRKAAERAKERRESGG